MTQRTDHTLRELQVNLPWTIRYSSDFRANPQPHKDFAHALTHIGKAAGQLHAFVDDMDHRRDEAEKPDTRERYAKYVADMVVCALRLANTFPGGPLDLQASVRERLEGKNGVTLAPPGSSAPPPMIMGQYRAVLGTEEVERLLKLAGDGRPPRLFDTLPELKESGETQVSAPTFGPLDLSKACRALRDSQQASCGNADWPGTLHMQKALEAIGMKFVGGLAPSVEAAPALTESVCETCHGNHYVWLDDRMSKIGECPACCDQGELREWAS